MKYTRVSQLEREFGVTVHYDVVDGSNGYASGRSYYIILGGDKVRIGTNLSAAGKTLRELFREA